MTCPLCQPNNEDILFSTEKLRVITVHDDPVAPAFCRVIWQGHVKEMTDLSLDDAHYFFGWVLKVEKAMREVLNPTKINLATLGNMAPHLHWHVIARFDNDACFPQPIWAANTSTPKSDLTLPLDWTQKVANLLMANT